MNNRNEKQQGGSSQPYASRRKFLGALAAAALGNLLAPAHAHGNIGPVRPAKKMPAASVLRQDGARMSLQSMLQGKTTALQLMFTSCSSVCPLQGAGFAAVQERLPHLPSNRMQLLSLSIDPMGDDPAALIAWLRRFGARPGWNAAVPEPGALDVILDALQERTGVRDKHDAKVYVINPQGLLVWRTEDFPPTREIVNLLAA